FFVVSGFCVAAARIKNATIPFWYRRLMRIYPPYWMSSLLVLAIIAFRLATVHVNDVIAVPRDVGAWLYTALALTTPASKVSAVNWVYWSLAYELAFYAILGLCFSARSMWLLVALS